MKPFVFAMLACMAVASVCSVTAQTPASCQSGLYMSAADFTQNKLSCPIDPAGNDKLKTYEFFGSSFVTVQKKGQKSRFEKKRLYGYRDCHGHDYRFVGNDTYRITDTAGFFVYTACKEKQGPGGKGWIKSTEYYFSTAGDAPLQLLTIDNLKKAYPGNHHFQYEIDAVCHTDKDLIDYDVYTNTYRVKYLFSQSFK